MESPTRPEALSGQCGEGGIDQTSTVMTLLGPRIRKIHMNGRQGGRSDHPVHEVGCLHAQPTEVLQSLTPALPVDLSQPSKQSFHTQEIHLRMSRRILEQEGAIPSTQLQFDRSGVAEEHGKIEPTQNVGPDEDRIGKEVRRHDDPRRLGAFGPTRKGCIEAPGDGEPSGNLPSERSTSTPNTLPQPVDESVGPCVSALPSWSNHRTLPP